MKPIAILGLALAVSTAAGLAFAQQASTAQARAGQHVPGRHDGKARLDINQDGVIDRAEAAAHPRLAANFDKLDRNHDGRLQASERPQRQGRKGKGRGDHSRSGGIAHLDSNGDGRISRDEVADKPRFAENFAQIDGNRDGYLVRSEMSAWHERIRPQRQAERSKRFDSSFAAADLNRDGKLSKVEVSEKMPRLEKGFAWMDENRDGFLSREELRPRHR